MRFDRRHSAGTDEICHGKYYDFIVSLHPPWNLLLISVLPPFFRFQVFVVVVIF